MHDVGRKRTPGLEWLDPENLSQHLWVREYLLARGYEEHFHYKAKVLPDTPPSHQEMLQIGGKIEQEDGAHELFQGMKAAWRQERNRQKKKETGHLACLFILKGDTKENLKEMAKELDTDATALLEKLIAKAYKAHQRKKDKTSSKQLKQTLQGDCSHGLENIKEILSGDTPQPNTSITQGTPLTERSTDSGSPSEQPVTMEANDIAESDPALDPAQIRCAMKKRKKYIVPDMRQVQPPSFDQVEALGTGSEPVA
jgi:hypothetical protein